LAILPLTYESIVIGGFSGNVKEKGDLAPYESIVIGGFSGNVKEKGDLAP
jgi:hypothetical protein